MSSAEGHKGSLEKYCSSKHGVVVITHSQHQMACSGSRLCPPSTPALRFPACSPTLSFPIHVLKVSMEEGVVLIPLLTDKSKAEP